MCTYPLIMSKKTNVLVVEDDPNLGTLLTEYLNAKGYAATLAVNGKVGFEAYKKGAFDFLILDVMMPVKDGFTLAREIRATDEKTPILFLTAKSMKDDTFEGFKAGADDYMTKPFSMEELLMRMNAILRRTSASNGKEAKEEFEVGQFRFDYQQQGLFRDGSKTKLTTKENELMLLLCRSEGGVLERNEALIKIWGDDNYFNGRSMDVYIAKLRKHLKADDQVSIVNVHGKGFKLLTSAG